MKEFRAVCLDTKNCSGSCSRSLYCFGLAFSRFLLHPPKDHDRNLMDHTSLSQGAPWCFNAPSAASFHNKKSYCASPSGRGKWFSQLSGFGFSLISGQEAKSEQNEIAKKYFLRTQRPSISERTLGNMQEVDISCWKKPCSRWQRWRERGRRCRWSLWCILSYSAGLSEPGGSVGHVISRLQCIMKHL